MRVFPQQQISSANQSTIQHVASLDTSNPSAQPQSYSKQYSSNLSHHSQYILGGKREPCRFDWVESPSNKWIHLALWWWIQPILSLGNRRSLIDDDFSDISMNDKCSVLLIKADYDISKWPGTWNVIRQTFMKDFFETMATILVYTATRIAQPLLIRELIVYISNASNLPTYIGYVSAVGLGIISIVQAIIYQQTFFQNQRVGIRIRNTLSCAIYQRLMKINQGGNSGLQDSRTPLDSIGLHWTPMDFKWTPVFSGVQQSIL
ncbi:unnamed protein product [Rotaria socialis]|uniref:ABC transmembrane type-1 domain-containing protein n=1 Tax=Rotaria socialis TaxID=392032 RepID=A0A817XCZ6_9BILA|nr:unnamed protein product [Rotaria socialis]